MNAHVSIVADSDGWPEAIEQANAWRGRCVSLFARGEAAIGQTLFAIWQKKGRDERLPSMLGQRIEALRRAIVPDAACSAEHKTCAAIEAFAVHLGLRNVLCHAPGTIARDRSGHWLLLLEMPVFRNDRCDHIIRIVRQGESQDVLERVRCDTQRMETRLRTMREGLADTPDRTAQA